MANTNDSLVLGGREFHSRFILGSGKYSMALIEAAVQQAGAEIITLAVKNDIVVYSAHTNADKAAGGVNTLMAERLGLQDCAVLSEDGFGLVGRLPQPMPCEEFIAFVKKQFSLQTLRASHLIDKPIEKVALCSGSGVDGISGLVITGTCSPCNAAVAGFFPADTVLIDLGIAILVDGLLGIAIVLIVVAIDALVS